MCTFNHVRRIWTTFHALLACFVHKYVTFVDTDGITVEFFMCRTFILCADVSQCVVTARALINALVHVSIFLYSERTLLFVNTYFVIVIIQLVEPARIFDTRQIRLADNVPIALVFAHVAFQKLVLLAASFPAAETLITLPIVRVHIPRTLRDALRCALLDYRQNFTWVALTHFFLSAERIILARLLAHTVVVEQVSAASHTLITVLIWIIFWTGSRAQALAILNARGLL